MSAGTSQLPGGLDHRTDQPSGRTRVALMQPYFFPYIGYFDLVASADIFVFYDDAAFSKNGWYNRNRILSRNKEWEYVRVSLQHAPLNTPCNEVRLKDKQSDLNRTKALLRSYARAPHYAEVVSLVDAVFARSGSTLASIAAQSIIETCNYLGLPLRPTWSSELAYDRGAPALAKVLQICRQCKATDYVNLPGGKHLYNADDFRSAGLDLHFTPMCDLTYEVGTFTFVPNLSVLDALMWLSPNDIVQYLCSRKVR